MERGNPYFVAESSAFSKSGPNYRRRHITSNVKTCAWAKSGDKGKVIYTYFVTFLENWWGS